jgi:adenylate cyclase
VVKLIRTVKAIFKRNPRIAGKMLAELDNPNSLSLDNNQRQILRSLINLYQSSDTSYLNFYGPPGTFKTIPYYQVLQTPLSQKPPDVAGKAVFIGHSEQFLPAQQDAYYTIFSQANGVDLSGVEIAATAFANLLEDMPVRPIRLPVSCIIVFVWGAGLAMLCFFFSAAIAITSIIGLSILYLSFASHQFNHSGIWYPLVIPLFFQAPLTLYYTVLEKYVKTNKERKKIRSALGYYLPARVADEMAKNLPDMRTAGHLVYGTCLSTDAEGYTTLSEMMPPGELKGFLNGYYEKIFFPVKQHGGIISDVVGDAMLAVWASAQPDATIKQKACLAAMDIANAIQQFNQSSGSLKLPTRIGLHSGEMVLGNIGAMDHYEYRPVGDIVNTVSRIERLNKPLNTWVLISQAVREGLDGFLIREAGTFLLTGKSKPMVIYELLGCLENTSQEQKDLCAVFSEGLTAYKQQFWEEATKKFCTCMNVCKDDGLSKFYAAHCDTYKENPPEEGWNGVVCLDKK